MYNGNLPRVRGGKNEGGKARDAEPFNSGTPRERGTAGDGGAPVA